MNLFPCTVTAPDGITHRVCRLVDYGDQGYVVWGIDPTRGKGIVPLVITPPGSARTIAANTVELTVPATWDVDAQTWQITREGHCGCGHPLKRRTPSFPVDTPEAAAVVSHANTVRPLPPANPVSTVGPGDLLAPATAAKRRFMT